MALADPQCRFKASSKNATILSPSSCGNRWQNVGLGQDEQEVNKSAASVSFHFMLHVRNDTDMLLDDEYIEEACRYNAV